MKSMRKYKLTGALHLGWKTAKISEIKKVVESNNAFITRDVKFLFY